MTRWSHSYQRGETAHYYGRRWYCAYHVRRGPGVCGKMMKPARAKSPRRQSVPGGISAANPAETILSFILPDQSPSLSPLGGISRPAQKRCACYSSFQSNGLIPKAAYSTTRCALSTHSFTDHTPGPPCTPRLTIKQSCGNLTGDQ